MIKNHPAYAGDARDAGSFPGSGRSPGKGNGNWLQYSCLGNPMDRGTWQATVHGVAKSWTQLSDFTLSKQDFWIEMVRVDILTLFLMLWKHFQFFNIKNDVSCRFCTNIFYRLRMLPSVCSLLRFYCFISWVSVVYIDVIMWLFVLYWYTQFSSVQSLSRVRLFATPGIAARQASLSITNSRSSLTWCVPNSPLLFPVTGE